MPLVRGSHSFDHSFTQVPNAWLRDVRLTFKARGLLASLLSHSEGWSLNIMNLVEQNREGKDSIRAAIIELESLGYLVRTQVNENGRFGETFWTTQDPEPMAGLPMAGFPLAGNPHLKNTKLKNTNLKNTKAEIEFLEFWELYPVKRDKAKAKSAFMKSLSRAKFEDILAGVAKYKADPTRSPDFTKYPATWLNADGWENDYTKVDDTALQAAQSRRQRDLDASRDYLAKQKSQTGTPPPSCEHSSNKLLCRICQR